MLDKVVLGTMAVQVRIIGVEEAEEVEGNCLTTFCLFFDMDWKLFFFYHLKFENILDIVIIEMDGSSRYNLIFDKSDIFITVRLCEFFYFIFCYFYFTLFFAAALPLFHFFGTFS